MKIFKILVYSILILSFFLVALGLLSTFTKPIIDNPLGLDTGIKLDKSLEDEYLWNLSENNAIIENLKKSIESQPDNYSLHYQLGKAYFLSDLLNSRLAGARPGTEPELVENSNRVGVLLVHGFTASPWETRKLAEHLASHNITVYNMRVEGHGTSLDDLEGSSWEEWYSSVEDAYNTLSEMTNEVYAVGLSTGGSLVLYLAERKELKGVVSISSPIYFSDWKAKFSPLLKYFVRYNHRPLTGASKDYYYENRPLKSVAELIYLIRDYKKDLPKVEEPALIIHSANDKTVSPESAEYIYENIGSTQKEMVWVNSSEHVTIRLQHETEEEKEIMNTIFLKVSEFINE